MCENKLQCIICSDIHMSHNDNSRNVSHTFLIDHNLSGPGRSHAQAAKQHLLLISRPPARWATGFSGDLQHNYLLLYIMFCFCNVCTIVLEINILLLLLLHDNNNNKDDDDDDNRNNNNNDNDYNHNNDTNDDNNENDNDKNSSDSMPVTV